MKNHNPVISVRLMTFNHENFFSQAIEGCIIQDCSYSFEVVIGDDFSTDRTLNIALEYESKYPDIIRVLSRQKGDDYDENRKRFGRLYNFMDILSNCQGKYIALLDGDDYWTDPLKLQKQVDFLEANPDYVLTGHDVKLVDADNHIIKDSYLPCEYKADADEQSLKLGFLIPALSMVFRNLPVLKAAPPEFLTVVNGDTVYTSLLGQYGKYKFFDDITDAFYRKHQGGVWSSMDDFKRKCNHIQTYNILQKYYTSTGDSITAKLIEERLLNDINVLLSISFSNNNKSQFIRAVKLYLARNLLNIKKYNYLIKVVLKFIKNQL